MLNTYSFSHDDSKSFSQYSNTLSVSFKHERAHTTTGARIASGLAQFRNNKSPRSTAHSPTFDTSARFGQRPTSFGVRSLPLVDADVHQVVRDKLCCLKRGLHTGEGRRPSHRRVLIWTSQIQLWVVTCSPVRIGIGQATGRAIREGKQVRAFTHTAHKVAKCSRAVVYLCVGFRLPQGQL